MTTYTSVKILIPCHHSEIDSNFSKAHRIVTTSILPIVEQYAQHSQGVWEGSKVRISSWCS